MGSATSQRRHFTVRRDLRLTDRQAQDVQELADRLKTSEQEAIRLAVSWMHRKVCQ